MTSEVLSSSNSKRRRIMIITGDESIMEQMQNSNNSSSIKSFIIESKEDENHHQELMYSAIKSEAQSSNQKKVKHGSLTCVVCGSPALGYNFDAITCESCKAFFRRNALKNPGSFQCRRKGGCEITLETRRRCSACRLSKCLSNGMKRDRLQTSEEKAAKRREIEENRSLSLQIHHDPFDDQSHIISSTFLDQDLSTSEVTNLFRLTDFAEFLPQPPRALLSTEDLQRVETIQNSYEQRIELAARDGLPWNPSIYATTFLQHINSRSVPAMRLLSFFRQIPEFNELNVSYIFHLNNNEFIYDIAARDGLPWNPSIYATTFLQHINSRSVPAMRLLSFFRQIPEFNELNVDDKVTLIKYNLMPLVILNNTLSYNAETKQVVETDSDVPWDPSSIQTVHGTAIFLRVQKVFNSFLGIAKYDQRIIQLVLIVLILTKGFSTDADANEPILNDGMAVYRAQSYYTELLWRYMESAHGLENAVQIFKALVAHFISWQTVERDLRISCRKLLATSGTNELLPIMKSLLHIS
ncbi:unnamed protein product [Adineta steineri]|uniref:Nuclear receptor domain-containing protein n=1 Tax=Adineta steineri TaxID=433720 RepID=A0A815S6R6_9BILA|nr:unnamed protein product [Adineta steineri]